MTDFFELERKCKALRIKKIFKYSIFIFIISIITFLILYQMQTKKQPKKIIQQPTKHINISKPKITHHKENIKKTKKKSIIKKTPPKPKIIEPTLNLDIDLSKIEDIKIKKTKKKSVIKKTPPKRKPILQEETISFAKAIKLAEIYYNNSDYKNSIKWCKLAAKIDNNNEKVWKLYALNFEKIGQKEKAIKILKTYLEYKDSIELKYLLKRLMK